MSWIFSTFINQDTKGLIVIVFSSFKKKKIEREKDGLLWSTSYKLFWLNASYEGISVFSLGSRFNSLVKLYGTRC